MIAFPFWDENPKILMRNAGFDGSILCKSPISKGIRKKQKLCKCLLLATPLLFPAPKILLSVGHLPSVPNRSPNSRPPHDRLHDQPLYQTHDQPHDRPIADSMSNSITDTNAMTINGHDWPYDRSTVSWSINYHTTRLPFSHNIYLLVGTACQIISIS